MRTSKNPKAKSRWDYEKVQNRMDVVVGNGVFVEVGGGGNILKSTQMFFSRFDFLTKFLTKFLLFDAKRSVSKKSMYSL